MHYILCIVLIVHATFARAVTATMTSQTNLNPYLQELRIDDEDLIDNCDYLETENDLDHTLGVSDDLNIIQLNIRGLIAKQQNLIQETTPNNDNKKVDIYILCETWLTEHNHGMINIPNYLYIGKHRKNKRGGGVGILIHNSLTFKERPDITIPITSDLEVIFVDIKTNRGNLIVGSMYRPPHTNEKQFVTDYGLLLKKLKMEKNTDILIGMDHNMDLLKMSKHKQTQKFLDLNLDEDLLPTITKPTRITGHSSTLLDNIFISRRLQSSFISGIITTDLSDHLPTLTCLKDLRHETRTQKIIKYRSISTESIKNLNDELNSYNWMELLGNLNTEDAFNTFHNALVGSFNTYMPEKTKRVKNRTGMYEPWITKGIVRSMGKLKQLYIKMLKNKENTTDIEKYKAYRRILQQVKRKTKMHYYRSRCKEFKNNTRKLWSVINTITGRTKKKETIIESLKIDNIKTRNSTKITNELSSYFANVGRQFADKIPSGKHDIKYYLQKIPPNDHSIFLTTTNKTEITKLISSLKNKTSSGHDGISNKILKGITDSIVEPLNIIFNKSLEEGVFPTEMKKADTVPLYKSKDKDDKNNYRPISLLLTVSKLLEKIMYNRTYNFLTKVQSNIQQSIWF